VLSLHEDGRTKSSAQSTLVKGQIEQVLSTGLRRNWLKFVVLVTFHHSQMQAEVD